MAATLDSGRRITGDGKRALRIRKTVRGMLVKSLISGIWIVFLPVEQCAIVSPIKNFVKEA